MEELNLSIGAINMNKSRSEDYHFIVAMLKKTMCLRVFSLAIVCLFILSVIPNTTLVKDVTAQPPSTGFMLWCKEPDKDVGNAVGRYSTNFEITVKNYGSSGIVVSLSVSPQDTTHWTAFLVTNSLPVAQNSEACTELIVTAKSISPPAEGEYEQFTITGIYGGDTDEINVVATMNSYEPYLNCDESYKHVMPGYSVDYPITVTNKGQVGDTFDLDYNFPSGDPGFWTVSFKYSPGGADIPDTNGNGKPDVSLAPNADSGYFIDIVAEITATGVTDTNKYLQQQINIKAISENSGEEFEIPTYSLVSWLSMSISDDDTRNQYYAGKTGGTFHGHNANSGHLTTYVVRIFKANTGQGTITFNINNPQSWNWELYYENDGETQTPAGGVVNVESNDIPQIGDYKEVILTVNVPPAAVAGNSATITITASGSGISDSVALTTKVVSTRKVYIINVDSMDNDYMDLDKDGGSYVSGDRLTPNIQTIIDSGSRYTAAVDVLPSGTDTNHVGLITSAHAGTTGIYSVGAAYFGLDGVTDKPTFEKYTHDMIKNQNGHIQTIYNTMKTINPDYRTAVVTGKNWVGNIFEDEGVDCKAHGREHPYYLPDPEEYTLGDPAGDTDTTPRPSWTIRDIGKGLQKHFPSDLWVANSAMDIIRNEDPDFLYILLANADDCGHLNGAAWNPSETPQLINPAANEEDMLDVIYEADNQIGGVINLLNTRNTYDDSIVVVTADHSMNTVYADNVYTGHDVLDLKEFLAVNGIAEGTDYDFMLGSGGIVGLYGFNTGKENNAVSLLEAKPEVAHVLTQWDRAGTLNDFHDVGLYSDYYIGSTSPDDQEWPEIMALLDLHYQNRMYSSSIKGAMNMFNFEAAFFPPRGYALMVGSHGTHEEQHIPLVLRDPNIIRMGYTGYGTVNILDIAPTICEINGWNTLSHTYFSDHDAEGVPLWDCITTGVTTFDPKIVADSSENLHSVWWTVSEQVIYSNVLQNGPVAGVFLFNGKEPDIAINPTNDDIYIVWSKEVNSYHQIFYSMSSDGGSTWSSGTQVTSSSGDSVKPTIAIDIYGYSHLIYEDNRDGDFDIYSQDNWANEQKLTSDSVYSGEADAAIEMVDPQSNGYSIHLVWRNNNRINHQEGTINSGTGNVAWGSATNVDTTTNAVKNPAVTVDTFENIMVVWADSRNSGDWEIYARPGWFGVTTGGSTWGSERRFTNSAGESDEPDIITDEDGYSWTDAHIVWHDNRVYNSQTDYEIYYKKLSYCNNQVVNGATGTDLIQSDDDIDSKSPSITVTSTGLHIIWADDTIYVGAGNPTPLVPPTVDPVPSETPFSEITVTGYAAPGANREVRVYVNNVFRGSDPPSTTINDCGKFEVTSVSLNVGNNNIEVSERDTSTGFESERSIGQNIFRGSWGVNLDPNSQSRSGVSLGSSQTYSFTIINDGTLTNSYTLTKSGTGSITGGSLNFNLGGGASTTRQFTHSASGSYSTSITSYVTGTGTGASPIIAREAREAGALTVAVVTKPFKFEGEKRMRRALEGIERLAAEVDSLIIVPNERLKTLGSKSTTFKDLIARADDVLLQAVRGISDLIMSNGFINLDFADVKKVMEQTGTAIMGMGTASGENSAAEAAQMAINSPLLEDISIGAAKGILMNVTGSSSMSMDEIDEACNYIKEEAEDAEIFWGIVFDDEMEDEVQVTVIATGIDGNGQRGHSVPMAEFSNVVKLREADPEETAEDWTVKMDGVSLDTPTFQRQKRGADLLASENEGQARRKKKKGILERFRIGDHLEIPTFKRLGLD